MMLHSFRRALSLPVIARVPLEATASHVCLFDRRPGRLYLQQLRQDPALVSTAGRRAVTRSTAMTLDSAWLGLLKQFEGCRLDAYQDTAGVWTIGYGHTDGEVEGVTQS
jgi:hypothetical protein